MEILGQEYSFASGGGVFHSTPKAVPNARFRESVKVGVFDGGEPELRRALRDLEDDGFGHDSYNLIRRNCNHFANALCWRLLQKQIPPHINRLADLGSWMSCLIPKKLLENAPVNGDLTSGANSGSSGFKVYPGRQSLSQESTSQAQIQAFTGSGARVGSTFEDTTVQRSGLFSKVISRGNASSNSHAVDNLEAKRERARKAALSRFEKNAKATN